MANSKKAKLIKNDPNLFQQSKWKIVTQTKKQLKNLGTQLTSTNFILIYNDFWFTPVHRVFVFYGPNFNFVTQKLRG